MSDLNDKLTVKRPFLWEGRLYESGEVFAGTATPGQIARLRMSRKLYPARRGPQVDTVSQQEHTDSTPDSENGPDADEPASDTTVEPPPAARPLAARRRRSSQKKG